MAELRFVTPMVIGSSPVLGANFFVCVYFKNEVIMSKVVELFEALEAQFEIISKDKDATIAGVKSAGARVRKATLAIAKIGKDLRTETIAESKK